MPSALTERHRVAQLGVGALVVRRMQAAWATLDPEDLDGTFADWLALVTAIVESGRAVSSQLAANYLNALRAQRVGARFPPVLADALDSAKLSTSMLVTGPVSIRSNLTRMTLERATSIAEERSAAAAMRHSMNGGRETITETIKSDPRGRGWERVTSGNACDFCESLAGRVFSVEDSAGFEAHDRCGCSAEPVYA